MRVILGADEDGPLPQAVLAALVEDGHQVALVGPLAGGRQEWAAVGAEVGRLVAGDVDAIGIVVCWTGTGVSIAANKVPGVRAALCGDAETAHLARRYNHANVLALSMRSTSEQVGREITRAFLEAPWGVDEFDVRNVAALEDGK